jgi:hypothetical protein
MQLHLLSLGWIANTGWLRIQGYGKINRSILRKSIGHVEFTVKNIVCFNIICKLVATHILCTIKMYTKVTYILSRVCGNYTRRGLDCQLDLLGLDTDILNHSVYTSQPTCSWVSLRPSRLATTLMASLAFTKLLSLGLRLILCYLPHCPRYMTFGRTVEKTLPLALLIV